MIKMVPSAWRISLWPGPEPFRNVLPTSRTEAHDMEVDMESYPMSIMELVLPEGAEVTVCARKMKCRPQILVGSTLYCLVMCSHSGVVLVWMPSLHKDSFICRQAD